MTVTLAGDKGSFIDEAFFEAGVPQKARAAIPAGKPFKITMKITRFTARGMHHQVGTQGIDLERQLLNGEHGADQLGIAVADIMISLRQVAGNQTATHEGR